MEPKYEVFLVELIQKRRSRIINQEELTDAFVVRSECRSFSEAFCKKFPELRLQEGFYGRAEHVWCVDSEGTIVDPTRAQFSYEAEYRNFDPEKDHIRLGRCLNCGMDLYGLIAQGHRSICDDECAREFETYLNAQ